MKRPDVAMSVAIVLVMLIAIASVGKGAQPPFETRLSGSRRAISAGEAKKALEFFEKQAADFERDAKSDSSPAVYLEFAARAYREASNTAFYLGNLQKAVDHGEKAFALASEIDHRFVKLTALSSLYKAYRALKNVSRAKELVDLGLELAQEFAPGSLNQSWWKAVFYAHRSSDFRERREYRKAIEDAERALRLYEDFLAEMPDSGRSSEARRETANSNMAGIYARLGRIYLAMGKTDDALKQYQRGLELAHRGNLQFSQVSLFRGLGDVYERRGEYPEALHYYQKALDLARQQQRSDALSDTARRMGDVYRKMGETSLAIASYGVAIDEIESIRSLLPSQNNRQSYFSGGLAAYTSLIETLWETRAYGKAFHYGESIRSRTFIDMLGTKVRLSPADSELAREEWALAELIENEREESEQAYQRFLEKVNNVNPEQASMMSVQPLKLYDVQRRLRPRQVLLEYLLTPERTYLWAVEQSRLRAYTIPLTRKDLVAKIKALRSAISNLSPLDDYQRIAQDLYDQLLGPVASEIRGRDLIIVPHDVLHHLPFHALYSPHGKYLVEDHALTYLSSASLLQFTTAKSKTVTESVFAIGNPILGDSKPQLPLAELEANEIRRLYPQSAVFVKSEGTEERVKALAPNYDVLHFATHAELREDDPLSSAILFSNEDKEDGRLEVREIFGMDLKASLVVLSGCETGLGKLSTGDELVGLTRAFIYAGTPSVVASLWKVDDVSTAYLMSSFYENLRTKTKVESLRQAQLDMLRGEVKKEMLAQRGVGGIGKLGQAISSTPPDPTSPSVSASHPYFWAPFILVGDGK